MNDKSKAEFNQDKVDFEKAVLNCTQNLKNKPLKICKKEKDIISLNYKKFKVVIYYSSYEYEIDFNFYINSKRKYVSLQTVLSVLGCGSEQLPKFLMTSNQTVTEQYISSFFELIDKFYDGLNDTKAILELLKAKKNI